MHCTNSLPHCTHFFFKRESDNQIMIFVPQTCRMYFSFKKLHCIYILHLVFKSDETETLLQSTPAVRRAEYCYSYYPSPPSCYPVRSILLYRFSSTPSLSLDLCASLGTDEYWTGFNNKSNISFPSFFGASTGVPTHPFRSFTQRSSLK